MKWLTIAQSQEWTVWKNFLQNANAGLCPLFETIATGMLWMQKMEFSFSWAFFIKGSLGKGTNGQFYETGQPPTGWLWIAAGRRKPNNPERCGTKGKEEQEEAREDWMGLSETCCELTGQALKKSQESSSRVANQKYWMKTFICLIPSWQVFEAWAHSRTSDLRVRGKNWWMIWRTGCLNRAQNSLC